MWEFITSFYESTIFVYGLTLLIIYAILAILSFIAIASYVKKNKYFDYDAIVSSPLTPGISVIAPAFNEGLTIISNVKSLLTLNYPVFEVIIVNDGSTDETLQLMIDEFSLIIVEFAYNPKIKTQPVKCIYKSTQAAFSKLIVIDKVNGKSKADASNAGVNLAAYNYFLCTDVDCILDKDTLLKLVEPIMKQNKGRVIATGATLRIANSCDFDGTLITRMRPPKNLIPRFQEIEYIRSFVMGKVGWGYINCVSNVSGGLGLFDLDIAIKAGGYDFLSFGEDMDLITRMCRYSVDNKIKYAICYVPITLCWTEGPSTLKTLMRQRTRWARGLAQIVSSHFSLLFNPRYGKMGMIAFPYIFFFELLAPVIEFLGILYFIFLIFFGLINWKFALLLLVFVYSYAVMISTLAILWDQFTFRYYKTWGEVLRLCLTTFLEFFLFHPFIVIFSIRGYLFFLSRKKHSWGNMERRGFNNTTLSTAK
ncbi:MAG: glycosyltransferase family 2 protein [Sphingobacteriales bacterium]|jgi:cellulose synthase/poly-beta-1,6-N-acetylglucosamine synthase-like glycosyltransferase|nr:MAG: glycosyltransferase family 2 protein [Sphingobacteriales bacterium]